MSTDALPSIDQLLSLPLPAPVSYWPQTWGWGVLLAVIAVLAAAMGWRMARRYRRNAYRRAALRHLDTLRQAAQANVLAARELPALLKRVGLSSVPAAGRSSVAPLTGADWMAWLTHQGGAFAPDAETLLRVLAYAPPEAVRAIEPARLQSLFDASRHWISDHHVAA